MQDAFSKYHPAVNFVFFLFAIGCAVVILHPAYLGAGLICAGVYYLLLGGKKALKMTLSLLPLILLITCINPLFNTLGSHILFRVLDRPYTLEALCYGAALAGMLALVLLWFGCYNTVLTTDKFTALFGSLLPSLSLLLVMVLRMIPTLLRKKNQISDARRAIGRNSGDSSLRDKLSDSGTVLSALTSWALEGSIVTADSMRCRGYGVGKRTNFQTYRMKGRDWLLLVLLLFAGVPVICTAIAGGVSASFTPELIIAPVAGPQLIGLLSYCIFLLIPSILHIKEAIAWHFSISRI